MLHPVVPHHRQDKLVIFSQTFFSYYNYSFYGNQNHDETISNDENVNSIRTIKPDNRKEVEEYYRKNKIIYCRLNGEIIIYPKLRQVLKSTYFGIKVV